MYRVVIAGRECICYKLQFACKEWKNGAHIIETGMKYVFASRFYLTNGLIINRQKSGILKMNTFMFSCNLNGCLNFQASHSFFCNTFSQNKSSDRFETQDYLFLKQNYQDYQRKYLLFYHWISLFSISIDRAVKITI